MIETEEVRTNKLPPISTVGEGLHILAVTGLADEAATVLVPAEIMVAAGSEIEAGGGVVDNNTLTGEGTEENPFQISEEYKLRINAGI